MDKHPKRKAGLRLSLKMETCDDDNTDGEDQSSKLKPKKNILSTANTKPLLLTDVIDVRNSYVTRVVYDQ
ncbi:hypothetical protein C0J52_17661 [Blattella germanica]|nr:hypothetical protein C0J52_17661 [Blattella germanica]